MRRWQGVWIDLNEVRLHVRKSCGELVAKPRANVVFPVPGRPGQDDQPMDGHDLERKLPAQL